MLSYKSGAANIFTGSITFYNVCNLYDSDHYFYNVINITIYIYKFVSKLHNFIFRFYHDTTKKYDDINFLLVYSVQCVHTYSDWLIYSCQNIILFILLYSKIQNITTFFMNNISIIYNIHMKI